jgi:hypothetical protein
VYGKGNLVKTSAIIAGIVLSVTSGAGGRNGAFATAAVRVTIKPFVIVSPETAIVNVAVADVGLISATVTFHVSANTSTVRMSAAATALYHTGDPNAERVTPIPLHPASGVAISHDGNPAVADYVQDIMLDGTPAKSTRLIPFQSSQADRFSQDVGVTVTWNRTDPSTPAGLYRGKVKLTALIMP